MPADFKGQELKNLEGFLFPATYDFTEDTTSKELVLRAARRVLGRVGARWT